MFLTKMKTPLSPEEALRERWAQVQANLAYDELVLTRMREHSDLRSSAQKARYRRIKERQLVEVYKRDEIAKIASMCEIRLSP